MKGNIVSQYNVISQQTKSKQANSTIHLINFTQSGTVFQNSKEQELQQARDGTLTP